MEPTMIVPLTEYRSMQRKIRELEELNSFKKIYHITPQGNFEIASNFSITNAKMKLEFNENSDIPVNGKIIITKTR